MSRETLKEFLSQLGINADSISYGNLHDKNSSGFVDRGDDLGIDPNTNKELLKLSDIDKGILGDYVNYIALNYRGGNKYGISGGNKKSTEINRGSSIQDAEISNDSDVFARQATTLGDTLGKYSNSENFESSDSGLSMIIDKTSSNKELDGHTLLNIEGEDKDTTGSTNPGIEDNDHRFIKQMTSEMLQRNNRFSPGSRGTQYSKSRTESNDEIEDKNISKSQNSFGVTSSDGEGFIHRMLKKVGSSLLLKSAGLDVDTMDPEEFDPDKINDNIPTKIVARDIEAGNAFNSPVDRDERGAFDSSSGQIAITSHTVPGLEFEGGSSVLNEKLIASLDAILKEVIADDEEYQRENYSVYTTNTYFDSVERFLDATLRDRGLDAKDKAYFANLSRGVLRLEEGEKRDEKIRKILDVFAVIGDTDLMLYKDLNGKANNRMWDVDSLKDGPSTRISKSRSRNGFSTKSLAWRASSMPSMYHLPKSILRSVQNTGSVSKKNPVKAMLGSSLGEKTYLSNSFDEENLKIKEIGSYLKDKALGAGSDTTLEKIPKELVNIYEDMLDAEYVPFYFHDLRTNEILSFHAFLSDLSETFSASHTAYEGYGRMDDVQIYKKTTRTISGKFIVASTSREDFDEMWFKINKLVEMLYPQWSRGEILKVPGDSETVFTRPFSQIPAISPMIRLRIGDVIRGNYSRFNLGRLFGSGDINTYIHAGTINPTTVGSLAAKKLGGLFGDEDAVNSITNIVNNAALEVFMTAFGSPLQFLDFIPKDDPLGGEIKKLAFMILSSVLDNGFVNPLVLDGINKLKNPDVDVNLSESGLGGLFNKEYGPVKGNIVLIKPSLGKLIHYVDGKQEPILVDRFLKTKIDKIFKINGKTHYNVTVIDILSSVYEESFVVAHEDIIVDPDWIFENYFAWFLDPINNAIDLLQDKVNNLASKAGVMGETVDLYTTTFEDFMSPYNNSITRSFESSAGRGLAGFIGKLSYSLVGEKSNWEIDHGSRAPMMVEITFDFKPVHDIGPGLDSSGFSRAPVYNVGKIMNNIAGDQQGEGIGSKNRFNRAAINGSEDRFNSEFDSAKQQTKEKTKNILKSQK